MAFDQQAGLLLAMPVEKSGQAEFRLECGEELRQHIKRFDPTFADRYLRLVGGHIEYAKGGR